MMETYEDVSEALDKWLTEGHGRRSQTTGRNTFGRFFCRLESPGEKPVSATSDFSTNDATAKALALVEAQGT